MQHLIIGIMTITLGICTSFSRDGHQLLGDDVRLFKGSPVWGIAKAIEKGDTARVRKLLKNQPDSILNYQEKTYGQSLLNWAVYANNYPAVKVLAELGADPNLKGNDSTCAIIHAADKHETTAYLETLIKHGGNVNAVANIDGPQRLRTPLMAAAFKSLDNVKLLINAGADANFVYKSKTDGIESALYYAFHSNNMDIINYLIFDAGVDYKQPLLIIDGDNIYIPFFLRGLLYSLESEDYQKKMKLVAFLKENGIDYWKEPVPKYYYKNYDSLYLSKY